MASASNCPFCNAVLPPLSAPLLGDRHPCPRCGEAVPASRWQVDTAIAVGQPKITPPAAESHLPGNRNTAFIILGIMLTMAVIGLSYALWTTQLRRSRDPKPLLDPITFQQPLELKALGYLPKDSQIIVGLHIAEWLDDKKVGKPLLAEPRPAMIDWVLKQLPRTTGMTLEEIDHVVLATSFDKQFPQLVMVVKTRRPYDLTKLVDSVRPTESSEHQKLPLYEISLKPMATLLPESRALLWCVEEKTLLYVIRLDTPKIEHLQGLSATPRKLDEVLSAPLHEAMKERLPKHDFMWAVGRLDKLGMLKDWLLLMPAAKPYYDAVKDIKVFAVGLEPVEGLTMTGHFHLTDAKSAARFKARLEAVKLNGVQSQKVEGPRPDTADAWITWQVRGDVATMRELLNQGKDGKK